MTSIRQKAFAGMVLPRKRPPRKVVKSRGAVAFAAWRKRKRHSQTELAALLDTTQATVSRIEGGRFGPERDLSARIKAVMGIPVEWWGVRVP